MFDRGFATADDPASVANQPELLGRPREACAIFLGAIRELREGAPERDFDREVFFNSVHEIGHIFNLQHWFDEPNFLSWSPSKGRLPMDYKNNYLRFVKSHCDLLKEEPLPDTTLPGGSNFADTGLHADKDVARVKRRAARPFGLDIRIGLQRHSIAYFDPIELDVELRVLPGVERTFRLPDQIDPGYESFRIWIEEPDGRRRLYRCPRHYCRPQHVLTISPARPTFRRDVSIFGQSGGYTFRRAGIHRLWVEFAPGGDLPLRSNTIELEIVPINKLDRAAREGRALFTSRLGKSLLYHRVDDIAGRRAKQFLAFAAEYPRSALASEALYAVARAQATSASAVRGDKRAVLTKDTLSILDRLADNKVLSDHKREKCADVRNEILETTAQNPTPAVPARRSIGQNHILCLLCGQPRKLLRRHLTAAHDLTPADYRQMFGLKSDYPMVAPAYKALRSEIAKKTGLGHPKKTAPTRKTNTAPKRAR